MKKTIAPRYRKKPVEIEAMQWNGTAAGATPIINWVLSQGGTARYDDASSEHGEHIAIDTLEGTMRAVVGDFIIRGVQGEFYPCKPDIFEQTYDAIEESPAQPKIEVGDTVRRTYSCPPSICGMPHHQEGWTGVVTAVLGDSLGFDDDCIGAMSAYEKIEGASA